MADQDNTSAQVVEAKAKTMGWRPKENWTGNSDTWVDAAEFVKRGETMLPILKANNQRLENQVGQLTGQLSAATTALSALQASVEALKEHNTAANLTKVKEHKQAILDGIVKAKEDKDTAREVELTDQLSQTNVAIREAETAPKKAAPTKEQLQPPALDPVLQEWNRDNPWFGVDRRRSALALGIRDELAAEAQASGQRLVITRAILDQISGEVDRVFGGGGAADRVASGRNGAGNGATGGGGGNGSKGYSSLPAEAKAACDKFANKVVGPGKVYNTKTDEKALEKWQAKYAQDYFASEA